jgi:hypothetical protein
MNEWKYIKRNVTHDDIGRLEEIARVKIPQLVAEFIVEHNNGRPIKNTLLMPSGDERIFEKLLSFNQQDIENVFSTLNNHRDDFPDAGLVPVAMDPFGNYFCLNAINNFRVDFWLHESGATEVAANDFLTLINNLR